MSENHETTPAKKSIVHPKVGLQWPPFPSNLLSEDMLNKVKGVFDEMLGRLYHGADKRLGWATPEPWKELSESECRTCVRDALSKGNLIDAMNYIMFAHLNGHNLLTLRNPSPEAPVSVDSQMRDQLAKVLGTTGRTWEEMLTAISAALKDAYQNEKTLASTAKELNLDPDAPADTVISTVRTLVTARQSAVTEVNITGCTDPVMLENIAKVIKANNQKAEFMKEDDQFGVFDANGRKISLFDRKTGLSPAIAAPYGAKASKKQQQYELTMEADDSGIPSPLFIFRNKKDRDDYLPLLRTFLGALEQAAYGKGRERHANDLPFTEQPILTMARMLDSDAGLAQQVIKKTIEARSLASKKARINELRGTLVYAAAMILFEEMFSNKCEPFEELGI